MASGFTTPAVNHVNKSYKMASGGMVPKLPSQDVIDKSLINQKQGQLLQKAIKEIRQEKAK